MSQDSRILEQLVSRHIRDKFHTSTEIVVGIYKCIYVPCIAKFYKNDLLDRERNKSAIVVYNKTIEITDTEKYGKIYYISEKHYYEKGKLVNKNGKYSSIYYYDINIDYKIYLHEDFEYESSPYYGIHYINELTHRDDSNRTIIRYKNRSEIPFRLRVGRPKFIDRGEEEVIKVINELKVHDNI